MNPVLWLLIFSFPVFAAPTTIPSSSSSSSYSSVSLEKNESKSNFKSLEKRGYTPEAFWEKDSFLVGGTLAGFLGIIGITLGAQYYLRHKACLDVEKEQRKLQLQWDLAHPYGFIPQGGQMRPIDFTCSNQPVLKIPRQGDGV